MARRGFFAALHQATKAAARENERQARQAARGHASSVRHAAQNRRESERAQTKRAKTAEAQRKIREKETKEAHAERMLAEVDERNENLADLYEEIDTLLTATLSIDDHVDLNSLRVRVAYPPFDRPALETPATPPTPTQDPAKPALALPDPPRGLASFFGQRKHAELVQRTQDAHEKALVEWEADCRRAETERESAKLNYARADEERIKQLDREVERYKRDCADRETEAAERNREVDEFIANLGYGTADAVQEYVAIVLSNSVYPEHFKVAHGFEFEQATAELRLKVTVPSPDTIPQIKAFKYSKSADEISSTDLSQKEARERYANAVSQVALRSFHEVFEADRRGLIQTISLEVGTNAVDPSTGKRAYIPFIVAAAERSNFLAFDLSGVVPAMTLDRLGATVSKNPNGLVGVERAGVRRI